VKEKHDVVAGEEVGEFALKEVRGLFEKEDLGVVGSVGLGVRSRCGGSGGLQLGYQSLQR